MASSSQNTMTFQNKIFIQIEKDNAHMMFGFRINLKHGHKFPYLEKHPKSHIYKYEPIGYAELKSVNGKYEQMIGY